MGRKRIKIDAAELEKLCSMQCTDKEVAAWFGVSARTIMRRRSTAKFSDIMDRARAKGCVSVRRQLFRLSAAGNVAATIFLAKNLLGYRDVVNTQHSGIDGEPIELSVKPDLSKFSHEELEQLRQLTEKAQTPAGD